MVGEGVSSFVDTTSCRGFIVGPIATARLLLLTDIYAKASRTSTVSSLHATCGPLVSSLVRIQRASREEVLDVNIAAASITTASRSPS